MNKKLIITLKSDLCTGSGFGFAGVIDNDVCFDKYGIPYISGRRLKGCIKEAAEYIGIDNENIKKLFGERGGSEYEGEGTGGVGIRISDAYPVGIYRDTDELNRIYADSELKQYFNQENVINLFTSVKSQTSIDEKTGTAKENTLHFTRVINQYSFIDGEEVKFEAVVDIPDSGKKECDSDTRKVEVPHDLDNAVKATRNIGYGRNRGLGSVKLSWSHENGTGCEENRSAEDSRDNKIENNRVIDKSSENRGEYVSIKYLVKNTAPLIISTENNEVSLNYIPGSTVLGAFASQYLKIKGKSAEDDSFKDIFLNGRTFFSNLNLSRVDGETIINYYPVPEYINLLKKTIKLVDSDLLESNRENIDEKDKYFPGNGNQPKKLKGKYIAKIGDAYDIREVEKEIIYHHTNHNENLLYFFDAIAPNQLFGGEMVIEEKYKKVILDIFNKCELYFGKSKTAQYGRCEVEKVVIEDASKPRECKNESFQEGDIVRINLQSDAVFMDDKGNYKADFKSVYEILAKNLNVKKVMAKDTPATSSVITKTITGYSGIWNMHKPSIPAVAAGSVFVFKIDKDTKFPMFLGKKNSEGFGRYEITKVPENSDKEAAYALEEVKSSTSTSKIEINEYLDKNVKKIYERLLLDKLYRSMKARVFTEGKIVISKSALGRLTLMVIESYNDALKKPEENDKATKHTLAYKNLIDRVNSIKSNSTRDECIAYLNKVMGCMPKLIKDEKTGELKKAEVSQVDKDKVVNTILGKTQNDKQNNATPDDKVGNVAEAHYEKLEKLLSQNEAKNKVFEMWYSYLMEVLTYQKYKAKD